MKLQGKIAIVTGGGSGIGRAISLGLAREGADIAVADISGKRSQSVAAEVRELRRRSLAVTADVGYAEPVEGMVKAVLDEFGRIDILVNNAGIIRVAPMMDTTEEDWDDVLRTNLKSVFLCSRAVAKQMIQRGSGGKIINISSIHAQLSEPNAGSYTASKGGMEAFSRTLASELAPFKINVNCIEPGATYTCIGGVQLTPQDVPPGLLLRIPQREVAQPEWIAAGAVFLASDDARYMTGSVMTIDGGLLMDGSSLVDNAMSREPSKRPTSAVLRNTSSDSTNSK